MKKLFSITIITVVLFSLSFSVQPLKNEHFYYYFDEKIFLEQAMDQILIKFAPDASKEQLQELARQNNCTVSEEDRNFM